MLNDEGTKRDWKERQVREVDSKNDRWGEEKYIMEISENVGYTRYGCNAIDVVTLNRCMCPKTADSKFMFT